MLNSRELLEKLPVNDLDWTSQQPANYLLEIIATALVESSERQAANPEKPIEKGET
ncbi:MAG: hypothetical protein PF495_01690 [Spirochaetales bacterium]|jgi:hypothetical protein|nr:hypothetical protein [Spirochaetales bacterium]